MDGPEIASAVDLNLGTSTLIDSTEETSRPKHSNRFNPLDQLLGSDDGDDDDDDSNNEENDTAVSRPAAPIIPDTSAEHSLSIPQSASTYRRSPAKTSAVARLAMARRMAKAKKVSENDPSSSDSDDNDDIVRTPATKRQVSSFASLRIDSESESEADSATPSTERKAPLDVSNTRPTEETEPPADKKKQQRRRRRRQQQQQQPKPKDPNAEDTKARAASKAAMARIHEESARLIRETAVTVDPMEFTRPLELGGFLAKFDEMVGQKAYFHWRRKKINAALARAGSTVKVAGLLQHDSDGEDYELSVVDDDGDGPSGALKANKAVVPKTLQQRKQEAGGGSQLESILKHGSQPIHLTMGNTAESHGTQRTGGKHALRDLNKALLDAVYAEETAASQKPQKRAVRISDAAALDVKAENDGDDDDDAGSGSDADVAMGSGGGTEDEGEEDLVGSDGGDEAMEAEEPVAAISRKIRAAVVSDEEDDGPQPREAAAAAAEPAAASKARFLSMFKMPVAKPTTNTNTNTNSGRGEANGPLPRPEPQQPALSMPSAQNEADMLTASQDPLHLLSSQVDQLNTQDSLLMTPDPLPQQGSQDSVMDFGVGSSQLFPSMDDASDARLLGSQQHPSEPATDREPGGAADLPPQQKQHRGQQQPPTRSTEQETQLTAQLTAATADATQDGSGDGDSVLPTMVRRALGVPDQQGFDGSIDNGIASDSNSSNGSGNSSSKASLHSPVPPRSAEPQPSADGGEEERVNGLQQRPGNAVRGGRRYIRRGGGKRAAAGGDSTGKGDGRLSRTKKRAIRTEFVVAEAEEGESTDSDAEAGGRGAGGRFSWGGGPNSGTKASRQNSSAGDEEEAEEELDTDEEEAALLADPMINNDVAENSAADQAIRDLHRQQELDQDERDIRDLAKDIATGRLRNRSAAAGRGRTGFALADEEDYNDRQTRAERMEERLRQRRRVLAREIHDTSLAAIARNPETAAFAQAALMRGAALGSGGDSADESRGGCADADDDGFASETDGFELEEQVDDRAVAGAVQRQLARMRRRADSEPGPDDSEAAGAGRRIAGPPRAAGDAAAGGGLDGDMFTSVSVERLIVRRRTLMASASPRTALKRAGAALAGASTKRANGGAADAARTQQKQ
ncbi:hypothetical protein GGI11_001367 [Coemansia sp. RSA 2049]|nr:hypothetical protein GGI11_001367 [Coemansia sp. RSA 2049]